eukprot:GDKJ01020788.1.p1 GENE.GDKJ01020788.1~~GDKJ01020788.1.p1  ORF type:complete len:862 (+),score=186.35 GDKJ01020788.1:27-2588(+)
MGKLTPLFAVLPLTYAIWLPKWANLDDYEFSIDGSNDCQHALIQIEEPEVQLINFTSQYNEAVPFIIDHNLDFVKMHPKQCGVIMKCKSDKIHPTPFAGGLRPDGCGEVYMWKWIAAHWLVQQDLPLKSVTLLEPTSMITDTTTPLSSVFDTYFSENPDVHILSPTHHLCSSWSSPLSTGLMMLRMSDISKQLIESMIVKETSSFGIRGSKFIHSRDRYFFTDLLSQSALLSKTERETIVRMCRINNRLSADSFMAKFEQILASENNDNKDEAASESNSSVNEDNILSALVDLFVSVDPLLGYVSSVSPQHSFFKQTLLKNSRVLQLIKNASADISFVNSHLNELNAAIFEASFFNLIKAIPHNSSNASPSSSPVKSIPLSPPDSSYTDPSLGPLSLPPHPTPFALQHALLNSAVGNVEQSSAILSFLLETHPFMPRSRHPLTTFSEDPNLFEDDDRESKKKKPVPAVARSKTTTTTTTLPFQPLFDGDVPSVSRLPFVNAFVKGVLTAHPLTPSISSSCLKYSSLLSASSNSTVPSESSSSSDLDSLSFLPMRDQSCPGSKWIGEMPFISSSPPSFLTEIDFPLESTILAPSKKLYPPHGQLLKVGPLLVVWGAALNGRLTLHTPLVPQANLIDFTNRSLNGFANSGPARDTVVSNSVPLSAWFGGSFSAHIDRFSTFDFAVLMIRSVCLASIDRASGVASTKLRDKYISSTCRILSTLSQQDSESSVNVKQLQEYETRLIAHAFAASLVSAARLSRGWDNAMKELSIRSRIAKRAESLSSVTRFDSFFIPFREKGERCIKKMRSGYVVEKRLGQVMSFGQRIEILLKTLKGALDSVEDCASNDNGCINSIF